MKSIMNGVGILCFSPEQKEETDMTQTNEFEIDLFRICKALWKKAWVIVLCAIVLGGSVFAYSRYTYVPTYAASSIMCIGSSFEKQYIFEDNIGRVTSPLDFYEARDLVNTCSAMLKTRTVLEKAAKDAGVNVMPEKLAGMITTEAIDDTELFSITVTSNNPEEAAQIANAITQVLPEEMAKVNSIIALHTVDSAIIPSAPVSNSAKKVVVLAAVLGAMLACVIIVVPDILAQWKERKPRS